MLSNKIFASFVLCSILGLSSGWAQEILDTATISSSRLLLSKNEAGKSVTVLTQKDIQDLPANTIDEVLQMVAGVNLNSRGGFGVQADLGMRGSTYAQVLILVDNQRINDPLTGHFTAYLPIPLSEIAQIEIVRGPSSVSFGADAVGGVVHIKTKAFQSLFNDERSFSLQGKVSQGEHGLNMADLSFFQESGNFRYSFAIKSTQADGETLVNPNYPVPNANLSDSLYNNFFKLRTATGAVAYKSGKWKAYARLGIDSRSFAAKYFYTASAYDESVEFVDALWSQVFVGYSSKNAETEFSASYRNGRDSFVFNPLFTPNAHTTQRLNATLSQRRKVGELRLAYGVQADNQDVVSTDRGDHQRLDLAAFALANKTFKNKLRTTIGLRLEKPDNQDAQLLSQLNLALPFRDLGVFRTSFGQSLRQADFTERFVSYNLPNLADGRNAGNPDLIAEKAVTAEIGFDFNKNKDFTYGITLFNRWSNNVIDYVLTPASAINNLDNLIDTARYMYATNLGSTQTFGIEAEMRVTIINREKWSLRSVQTYTYLETNQESGEVSKYIANHPIHQINNQFIFSANRFSFVYTLTSITRNDEKIEAINAQIPAAYLVQGVKINYNSTIIPLSIFVEVRNLGNEQYQEILGAQMPGRWWMGGLSFDL